MESILEDLICFIFWVSKLFYKFVLFWVRWFIYCSVPLFIFFYAFTPFDIKSIIGMMVASLGVIVVGSGYFVIRITLVVAVGVITFYVIGYTCSFFVNRGMKDCDPHLKKEGEEKSIILVQSKEVSPNDEQIIQKDFIVSGCNHNWIDFEQEDIESYSSPTTVYLTSGRRCTLCGKEEIYSSEGGHQR